MKTDRDSRVRGLAAALRLGEDDEALLADLVDEGWSEDEANELLDEAAELLDETEALPDETEALPDETERGGPSPEDRGEAGARPTGPSAPAASGFAPAPDAAVPRVGLGARALLTAAVGLGVGLVRLVPARFGPGTHEPLGSAASWNEQFGPFAVGLVPFFTSFVVVELWAWLFRRERRLGDRELRRRMTTWAAGLGLLLALVQGWGIGLALESARDVMTGASSGPGSVAFLALTMAGGSALLVAAAFVVTRRGLGNGFAVIVLSGLLWSYGEWFFHELSLVRQGAVPPAAVLVETVVLGALFSAAVWFFLRAGRGSSKLPVRLPTSGLDPLTLAAGIVLFPSTLANLAPRPGLLELVGLLSPGTMPYAVAHVALVVLLVPLFSWLFYYRRRSSFRGEELRPLWRDALKRTVVLMVGLALLETGLSRLVPAAGLFELTGIVFAAAIVADLWQELRARLALRRGDDLVAVEVHHDLSDAVAASTRLAMEGRFLVEEQTYRTVSYGARVVVVQGLCYRSLGYFFMPWVPMVVLSGVRGERERGDGARLSGAIPTGAEAEGRGNGPRVVPRRPDEPVIGRAPPRFVPRKERGRGPRLDRRPSLHR